MRETSAPARPGSRRAAALALALLGATALLAGTAPADAAPGRYRVVAAATAGTVTYQVPDFLVVSSVGGGAPTAQATLSSTGGSSGFASSPYPGETVVGAPPTVRGLSGQPLPPDYPLYVESRDPAVPVQERSAPSFLLRSRSTETSTEAVARSGLTDPNVRGALSTAEATTTTGDDRTVASALLDVQSFRLADVLVVGRVRAAAQVTVSRTGKVGTASSLDVGQVSVAGQGVSVTPRGLVLVGTTTPLPDSRPLASALRSAGITLEYLQASKPTPGSVVSAGLRITMTGAAPPQVPAVGGVPVTATYVLGQASASASAVQDEPTPAAPASSAPDDGSALAAPGPAPAGRSADGGAPVVPALGSAPAATPAAGGTAAAAKVPEAPAVAVAPGGDPAVAAPRTDPVALSLDGELDGLGFYLVLVVAAVAALAGATVWRLVGVRDLWT